MAEENQVIEDGGREVEVAADKPPAGQTQPTDIVIAVAPAPAPPAPVEPPQNPAVTAGAEELQRQLKAMEDREASALRERASMERLARENAARASQAEEESARARGEVVDSRKSSIEASIIASQAESDVARRDYQLGLENGDFKKAAEANQKLISAAAKVAMLEERKLSFENPQTRPTEGAVRAPQRPADAVDTYIGTKSVRTQQWLRQHPETVTDPRLNNKTVAAHYNAIAEGYSPDTDAYFEFIDRNLGFAGQVAADPPPDDPARRPPVTTKPAAQTPPAAPVSRDSPRADTATRMYLSRGELETAEALGVTPSEYARRKQAMQKAGYFHT